MKKIGKPWFFVVTLLIFALTYLTFFGLYVTDAEGNTTTFVRGVKDIRWGTDIQGGVSVTFGPKDDIEVTDAQMNAVRETLNLRLMANNVTDRELYVDTESNRVMVSFPWADGETRNVEETISELAATAEVIFVEGAPEQIVYKTEQAGVSYVLDANDYSYRVAVDGRHIDSADIEYNEYGQLVVSLDFTDEGAKLFAESTKRQAGNYISIWLDGSMISCPVVEQEITDGMASITKPGGFSAKEAQQLANYINSGALPFTLETKDYDVIDATLGEDSLKAMMIAGIIAFAAICIFMIVYYKLPGVVACISLLGQAAGSLAAVSGLLPIFDSFTLTLPGIAGIILSIGMGVDANIITNERIKEEVLKGKTLDGAIDAGNENSFSSIFDGNITVIIVAVILMGVFGPPDTVWSTLLKPFLWMFPTATTGAIYSFGYTLLVGVIFNFLMGVTASRVMLKSLSRFKVFRNRKLYGGVDK